MTEFKVGDKVRYVGPGVGYDGKITVKMTSGSWVVRGDDGGLHRGVDSANLELMEPTRPSPPLYEGWEDDVRLLAFLNDSRAGTAAGDAARRLEAAFRKPRCEKQLYWLALDQQWQPFCPPVKCAREAHGEEQECQMKMDGLGWR